MGRIRGQKSVEIFSERKCANDAGFTVAQELMVVAVAAILLLGLFLAFDRIQGQTIEEVEKVLDLDSSTR